LIFTRYSNDVKRRNWKMYTAIYQSIVIDLSLFFHSLGVTPMCLH
jgi:hypothetical protein